MEQGEADAKREKRVKTKHPGVYFTRVRKQQAGTALIYIVHRKNGSLVEGNNLATVCGGRGSQTEPTTLEFRALHGLRHVYASMLASSGKVDMYTLQKLMTHKSPQMTQRYAHLRDESLRAASDLAGSIIEQAAHRKGKEVIQLAERTGA